MSAPQQTYDRRQIQELLDRIQYRLDNALAVSCLEQGDREAAALAWLDLEKKRPDSYHAKHNLAILLHRWAIELEDAGRYREANAHWPDALTYWCQIWQADPFWEQLAAKGEQLGRGFKVRRLESFRQRLPRTLLQINRRYAAEHLRHNAAREAKRHVRYIRGSRFPAAVIKDIRDELAKPFLVQAEEFRERGNFQSAARTLESFLAADPDHVEAKKTAGEVYLSLGVRQGQSKEYTEATASLEKALDYATTRKLRGDIYYNLAIIAWNLGNFTLFFQHKTKTQSENPKGTYNWPSMGRMR